MWAFLKAGSHFVERGGEFGWRGLSAGGWFRTTGLEWFSGETFLGFINSQPPLGS